MEGSGSSGSENEVARFLDKENLSHLKKLIIEESGIDSIAVLKTFTDEDLVNIGIAKIGERRKIRMFVDSSVARIRGEMSAEGTSSAKTSTQTGRKAKEVNHGTAVKPSRGGQRCGKCHMYKIPGNDKLAVHTCDPTLYDEEVGVMLHTYAECPTKWLKKHEEEKEKQKAAAEEDRKKRKAEKLKEKERKQAERKKRCRRFGSETWKAFKEKARAATLAKVGDSRHFHKAKNVLAFNLVAARRYRDLIAETKGLPESDKSAIQDNEELEAMYESVVGKITLEDLVVVNEVPSASPAPPEPEFSPEQTQGSSSLPADERVLYAEDENYKYLMDRITEDEKFIVDMHWLDLNEGSQRSLRHQVWEGQEITQEMVDTLLKLQNEASRVAQEEEQAKARGRRSCQV